MLPDWLTYCILFRSLQRTLTELREYQKQHEYWLRQHEKLLSEQAPPEVKLEQRLEYEEQKIRESLDGRGMGSCAHSEQCCGVPILFTVIPPSWDGILLFVIFHCQRKNFWQYFYPRSNFKFVLSPWYF